MKKFLFIAATVSMPSLINHKIHSTEPNEYTNRLARLPSYQQMVIADQRAAEQQFEKIKQEKELQEAIRLSREELAVKEALANSELEHILGKSGRAPDNHGSNTDDEDPGEQEAILESIIMSRGNTPASSAQGTPQVPRRREGGSAISKIAFSENPPLEELHSDEGQKKFFNKLSTISPINEGLAITREDPGLQRALYENSRVNSPPKGSPDIPARRPHKQSDPSLTPLGTIESQDTASLSTGVEKPKGKSPPSSRDEKAIYEKEEKEAGNSIKISQRPSSNTLLKTSKKRSIVISGWDESSPKQPSPDKSNPDSSPILPAVSTPSIEFPLPPEVNISSLTSGNAKESDPAVSLEAPSTPLTNQILSPAASPNPNDELSRRIGPFKRMRVSLTPGNAFLSCRTHSFNEAGEICFPGWGIENLLSYQQTWMPGYKKPGDEITINDFDEVPTGEPIFFPISTTPSLLEGIKELYHQTSKTFPDLPKNRIKDLVRSIIYTKVNEILPNDNEE